MLINLLFGCKKDDENEAETKKMYLTKVFMDGNLSSEYIYDANEKLPSRVDFYSTDGTISGYNIRKYSNGQLTESHNYNSTGVSRGSVRYIYNADNLPSFLNYYHNDTDSMFYHQYQNFYSNHKVFTMTKMVDSDGDIQWQEKVEFTGNNITKTEYFSANEVLMGTVYYSYDNKNNPYNEISGTGYISSDNNLLSRTSPDVDENGNLVMYYLGNSRLTVSLSHREYEYNEFNYPIRETRTLTATPNEVQVFTYEYK